MAKDKATENIVVSPVVVASSLGLVALGGKASTASQVKTVLSANKLKDEHLHSGLSELLSEASCTNVHARRSGCKPESPNFIHMSCFFSGEQRQDPQLHLED